VVTQSVVALAITIVLTDCLERRDVIAAMKTHVPPKLLDLNVKAYEAGEKAASLSSFAL
jgi:2-oxoglutarate ferredoxin oxidoreductase subunit gamma